MRDGSEQKLITLMCTRVAGPAASPCLSSSPPARVRRRRLAFYFCSRTFHLPTSIHQSSARCIPISRLKSEEPNSGLTCHADGNPPATELQRSLKPLVAQYTLTSRWHHPSRVIFYLFLEGSNWGVLSGRAATGTRGVLLPPQPTDPPNFRQANGAQAG
ncbi:hypothetical protein LX36DRAFT_139377 [Colletotrichum falcatum]|nr:hypothetical protein LX36DRAFT_139377 [Colletotrichum falcatum]